MSYVSKICSQLSQNQIVFYIKFMFRIPHLFYETLVPKYYQINSEKFESSIVVHRAISVLDVLISNQNWIIIGAITTKFATTIEKSAKNWPYLPNCNKYHCQVVLYQCALFFK